MLVDWTQTFEQRPDNRIALLKGWPAMTLDDAAIARVRSAGATTVDAVVQPAVPTPVPVARPSIPAPAADTVELPVAEHAQ